MAHVGRPEESGQAHVIRGTEALQASPLAEQVVSSKENLIATHLERAHYPFRRIPLLGRLVKRLFENAIAKKNFIKEIKEKFVADAVEKGCAPQLAKLVADTHLAPTLKTKPMEDLQYVDHFIDAGGGLLFLERGKIAANVNRAINQTSSFPESTDEGLNGFESLSAAIVDRPAAEQAHILDFMLRQSCREYMTELLEMYPVDSAQVSKALDDVVAAMRNNPSGIERALDTKRHIFPMMSRRFSPADRIAYCQSWIQLAADPDKAGEFNERFAQFDEFIDHARDIQRERPTIYLIDDVDKLGFHEPSDLYGWFGSMSHFLTGVCKEIHIQTVNTNTQLVHENLGAFFLPPGRHGRMRVNADLETRFDFSFSLSKEQHPDIVILEDGDEEVDLVDLRMRVFITNEKTMETRAMRLPIPIAGRMTKTEARALLQLLEATVDDPNSFDGKYDELGLPKEQKAETRKVFLAWADQAKRTMGKMVCDFNTSPGGDRGEFAFAREEPAMAAALANPDNLPLAREAAKGQNLFLLEDGRLSLLPSEIANPTIGEITRSELEAATALLRGGEEVVEIDLPGGKGKVTFETRESEIQDIGVVLVDITISRGSETYTHTTTLSLGQDEEAVSASQKIEEFISSGLLARDLLLTKAEFMEHVDRAQFSQLAEKLGPALAKTPYTDRALLLNFMVSPQGSHLTRLLLQEDTERLVSVSKDLLKALKENPDVIATIPPSIDPITQLETVLKVLGGDLDVIEERFNTTIRNALADKSPAERALVLNFLRHPACASYLERLSAVDDVSKVSIAIDGILLAMQNNPEGVIRSMATYPTVARMMGNRFAETDHLAYMNSWIELAGNESPEKFNEIFSIFNAFFQEAQRIQGERPTVHISADFDLSYEDILSGKTTIVLNRALLTGHLVPYPLIDQVVNEINESTYVTNTQMLHENIHCFLEAPDPHARTVPTLSARFSDNPLTLSREFHPDLTLYEDSEDLIDFRAFTNLAITNPKTMETRTMRVELPVSGRMTVTRARKLLTVLEETVKSPNRFDNAYDKAGLDPERKAEIKQAFTRWEAMASKELGKLQCDFNATETRPAFAFAREIPVMADALAHPDSLPRAVNAAKTKNIFLLDNGKRSLLPQECAHPQIGQLSTAEMGEATRVLIEGGKAAKVALPKRTAGQITFEEGDLSFKHEEGLIGSDRVVWVETTITRGEQTITRKTVYYLTEGQTAAKKLEEIAESGLLERDLLLAKAEFMDAHV